MTAKEKADKLCMRFLMETHTDFWQYEVDKNLAKQCALIAVDEILKSNPTVIDCDKTELNYKYWTEVKKEIDEL